MGRVGIVGAGPAGCLTARRLADAGHEVRLFEAGTRPTSSVDFATFLGRNDLCWPPDPLLPVSVIRARAVGGASAINGMLLSAPDTSDLDAWDAALDLALGSARASLERVIDDVSPQIAAPGPLARALSGAALALGEGIGGSTLDVDGRGVLVTALAARSGERRDAATVYLDRAPDDLVLVPATTIASLEQLELAGFDHVVVSAGALASPRLVTGCVPHLVPQPPQQHLAVALSVSLEPGQRIEREQPAVSRVLRWSTGLGSDQLGAAAPSRADVQLVVLDHMGWDAPGRAHGLVIVSLLAGSALGERTTDLDRARLRVGVRRAMQLLHTSGFDLADDDVSALPDAGDADLDAWIVRQPNPVHHVTSTLPLGLVVGPAGLVGGRDDLSVIDASVLPTSPRADTNLPVMVIADLLATQLVAHLA